MNPRRVLGSIGYNRSQLGSAARRLAYYIEEQFGYYAIPIPSGNWIGHYPYISLKICAEKAGLGSRSMAGGVILNSQYGLIYFNASYMLRTSIQLGKRFGLVKFDVDLAQSYYDAIKMALRIVEKSKRKK